MANTRETIESVRSLARVFQSVIDLAQCLDGIDQVEQLGRNADMRLATLNVDIEKRTQELAELNAAIAAGHADASRITDDAAHSAAQTREAADRYRVEQLAEIEQAESAHKETVRVRTEQLRDVVAQSEARRDAAAAELAAIETKLAKAKERMAKMLEA